MRISPTVSARSSSPPWAWLICLLTLVGTTVSARAELPLARLTAIFPAGGQVGTTVEVTLTGLDLDEVATLHFARPGIMAKPKLAVSTGQPEAGKFSIAIDPSVPPGLYDVRAVGRFGVTNPRAFQVGSAPEIIVTPGHRTADKAIDLAIGTTVNAVAEANASHWFRLNLKQGQRVVVQASTTSLDSKMEAVLVLADSAGHELAQSRRGSPLETAAPADGTYLLSIHDVTFRGGPEYFYRLSAVTAPDAQPIGKVSSPWPLPPAAAFVDPLPAGGQAALVPTNEPPHDRPDIAKKIVVPSDITGQFSGTHTRDWYTFDAPAGAVYWIEITCHRLGQPAAPMLLLQRITKDAKGQETAADVQEVGEAPPAANVPEFSTATRDPKCRLEVKEAGVYRLLVRNLVRGLSEADVMPYRLAVRKESPDFRLAVIPVSPLPDPKDSKDVPIWSTLLRRGGVTPVEVVAIREDGFAGEIQLSVDGLPPGVTTTSASISPAAESACAWVSA